MHNTGNRKPRLTEVAGIGQSTAAQLADHGIRTIEELAAAPVGKLATVRGFGATRAASVRKAAAGLLRALKAERPAAVAPGEKRGKAGERKKDKKKDKKKKDKKKKDKKGSGKKGRKKGGKKKKGGR